MASWLFVLPWIPEGVGGVDEAVLSLAGELKAGSRFRPIIGVTSSSRIAPPQRVRGIPVIGLKLHGAYEAKLWEAARSIAWLPTELPALARLLRLHEVDVVNVHFPNLAGVAFLLLRHLGLFRGKIVLTFHGSDVRRAVGTRSIARSAWRNYMRGADVVSVCSQALAAQLRGICADKPMRVIYNGADVGLFNRVARIRDPGTKRILHIGTFENQKAQDVLLAAVQLLLERGLDCALTMIGAHGPTFKQITTAAAAFGDRVRVLVNVPHERIPEYMAAADLFVLPSRAEGFPIVLIEAGAAGLPVVATNIGGVTELIIDNVTGLVVEPDDPRALADAMAKVLENEELAAYLGSRLRTDAVRYTWRRAANELVAALS